MIVLDIETSGLNFDKCGIWQIGAVELENPDNFFLDEAMIDDSDIVEEGALKVIGKKEDDLRDKKKQSQKKLLLKFFKWVEKIKGKNMICQNPQFDIGFITIRAFRYGIGIPFPHRSYDLHTIAAVEYYKLNGKFLIEDDKSSMNLTSVLKFCGIEDLRKEHNALEDAKLTGECFYRIVYGKSLFEEYTNFFIPEHIKKY